MSTGSSHDLNALSYLSFVFCCIEVAPFDCWISAVYHMQRPKSVHQRIDIEGRMIRVDLLDRWTKDDVRQFMRKHNLPYHKLAARKFEYSQEKNTSEPPFYGF